MKRTALERRTPLKRKARLRQRSLRNSRRRKYREELQTPRYQQLRLDVIARDNHACRRCGATERLEVHHVHYETFGAETGAELVTLCHVHHALEDEARLFGRATDWVLEPVRDPGVAGGG